VTRDLAAVTADRALCVRCASGPADLGEHRPPSHIAGSDPGDRERRARDRGPAAPHEPLDQLELGPLELARD
jgi:hypothetical protein